MTDKIFDIVIIGASLAGIDAYNAVRKNKNLNILVISKNFNKVSSGHSILKTDRLQATVAYMSYNHGLILLTLDNQELICGKKVVIATGSEPKQLDAFKDIPNVFYTPNSIKFKNKNMPIVIIGNNKQTATFALELAKKYNYIYICCSDQRLHCGKEDGLEVYWANNIAFLPLCNVVNFKTTKTGRLSEVLLDTYEHIKCGALLVSTDRQPDTSYLNKSFVDLDQNGYIKTTDEFRTNKIPNLFAIGDCRQNSSVSDGKDIAKYLLN